MATGSFLFNFRLERAGEVDRNLSTVSVHTVLFSTSSSLFQSTTVLGGRKRGGKNVLKMTVLVVSTA